MKYIYLYFIIFFIVISCYGDIDDNKLVGFLRSDNTDEHEYSDNYTCGYFSRDLVRNASGYGLSMGIIFVGQHPDLNGTGNHAMCWCYVGGDVVVIEPQSDKMMRLEDINDYKYYLLFPFGRMVPSTWDNKWKGLRIEYREHILEGVYSNEH